MLGKVTIVRRRSFELLSYLLASRVHSQVIDDLCKWFAISERTLRNEIADINDFLQQGAFDAVIVIENGMILIRGSLNYNDVVNAVNENKYFYHLSVRERVVLILMSVLGNEKSYITIDTIAQNLNVSRTSVINDLPKVREKSKRLGLSLLSKPNKGLACRSSEMDIYKALLVLFLDHLRDMDAVFEQMLHEAFGAVYSFDSVKRFIWQAQAEFGHRCSYKQREIMVYCAYVSVNRVAKGHPVELTASIPTENSNVYFYRYLLEKLGLSLPKAEELTLSALYSWALSEVEQGGYYEVDLQVVVAHFLYLLSDAIGIDFYRDKTLLKSLTAHFQTSINAKKEGKKQYNPYLHSVRDEYGTLFNTLQECLQEISRYFEYDPDIHEVSFVMMHVGASIESACRRVERQNLVIVCHEGIVTGRLLATQLRRYFDFNIKEILSAAAVNFYEETAETDLIISAFALKDIKRPVVIVNPILTIQDVINIHKAVTMISRQTSSGRPQLHKASLIENFRNNLDLFETHGCLDEFVGRYETLMGEYIMPFAAHEEVSCLGNLLCIDRIRICERVESWSEAVRIGGDILVEHQLAEPEYVNAMQQNVYTKGPYYVITRGVALAHAGSDCGVLSTGMSLVILRSPVMFGHAEFDPVHIIFGLSATESVNITTPLSNLIALCKSQSFYNDLRNADSAQEAVHIIRAYELGIPANRRNGKEESPV